MHACLCVSFICVSHFAIKCAIIIMTSWFICHLHINYRNLLYKCTFLFLIFWIWKTRHCFQKCGTWRCGIICNAKYICLTNSTMGLQHICAVTGIFLYFCLIRVLSDLIIEVMNNSSNCLNCALTDSHSYISCLLKSFCHL